MASVLIVDDDPRVVAALTRALGGTSVASAATIAAARNAVNRSVPFVVVLDNLLPDATGAGEVTWFVERGCKVVLISGYDVSNIGDAYVAGATATFSKVDLHEIAETVVGLVTVALARDLRPYGLRMRKVQPEKPKQASSGSRRGRVVH